MTKKLILLLVTCLLFTSCLFGCSDNNQTTDPTTTEVEVTTNKPEPTTTKAPETTTKQPETTTEEPTTPEEYVYRGVEFYMEVGALEYFSGLTLEAGDKIYVNDIYIDKSDESDDLRGACAYSLLVEFGMKDERKKLSDKYWTDGTDVPLIPYSDNYCIEYNGKKIEFIFVELDGDGALFDLVTVE